MFREGSGNPLQCSCLENPRDGGAWWAAVYGVTQSRTWLKWLSSSSSSGFAIHWHESAMGVHVSPIPNPALTYLPIPSLRVVPVYRLWVPCFMHWTWIGDHFTYGNIHVSVLFSQIIPPLPSSTESKRLFYTSVSNLIFKTKILRKYCCYPILQMRKLRLRGIELLAQDHTTSKRWGCPQAIRLHSIWDHYAMLLL